MKLSRKWLLIPTSAIMIGALAPLAIACGETTTPTTSYLDSNFNDFRVDPRSTLSNIRWISTPTFDLAALNELGYRAPEYCTLAFPNVAQAASDLSNNWTLTLPTTVIDRANPALWARFPAINPAVKTPYVVQLTNRTGLLALP